MPVSVLTFAGRGTTLPTDVSSVACGTSSIPASMHSSSELLDELEDDTHSPHRTVSICGKQEGTFQMINRLQSPITHSDTVCDSYKSDRRVKIPPRACFVRHFCQRLMTPAAPLLHLPIAFFPLSPSFLPFSSCFRTR